MARCCGSTGTCACKIVAGDRITVTGTGTAQDPFVVQNNGALNVESNETFALVLVGDGTRESPWTLAVNYAPSAELDDLPDVDASTPTNGQVLAWDDARGMWAAAPPTVAAAGGVLTDTSIDGDGSTADALRVVPDDARHIQVSAAGVGLTDDGINQLVRVFTDATARAAASPVPRVGTLSVLDSDPGRVDYYTGTDWLPIDNGIALNVLPGQLLQLSGPYAGGTVFQHIAQASVVTDTAGDFDVIPATSLTGFAGVLSVMVQETGTTAWRCVVRADEVNDRIIGTAYRLSDGSPLVGFAATAVVTAMLY